MQSRSSTPWPSCFFNARPDGDTRHPLSGELRLEFMVGLHTNPASAQPLPSPKRAEVRRFRRYASKVSG